MPIVKTMIFRLMISIANTFAILLQIPHLEHVIFAILQQIAGTAILESGGTDYI